MKRRSVWDCKLIEFNGESDHVHLLLGTTPNIQLSILVNNLKTVSSRLIRRDFKTIIDKVYRKPIFWHRSYCVLTAGGAPLEVLRRTSKSKMRRTTNSHRNVCTGEAG